MNNHNVTGPSLSRVTFHFSLLNHRLADNDQGSTTTVLTLPDPQNTIDFNLKLVENIITCVLS